MSHQKPCDCASEQADTHQHTLCSINTTRASGSFSSTGLLWCAASLVSSLQSIRLSSVLAATSNQDSVQVQAELWTESRGWDGEEVEDRIKNKVDFFGVRPDCHFCKWELKRNLSIVRKTTQARWGTKYLWVTGGEERSGMVWHVMVWCGVVGSAVRDQPLAPCASVGTFMRGPFVPGRQAYHWVNEQEQRRPSSIAAVCLHHQVPSYFISSPAHRQPLMS